MAGAFTAPAAAAPAPAAPDKTGADHASLSIPARAQAAMLAQRPFSETAKAVQLVIVATGAQTGFSGMNIGEKSVELWWKGRLPAAVQRAVDAGRRTVPIDVKPARYSRAELKKRAGELAAAMRSDPSSSLHTLKIPMDGSRVVAVSEPGSANAAGSTLRTSKSATGKTVDLGSSGIPVELREGERITASSRWNDGSGTGVFSGGAAVINTANGGRCTSGFGVRNDSGQEFLLTAGHCGRVGATFTNGNGSRTIGTASAEHVQHDTLLIPTNVDQFMWDGGATSNMFLKSVVGWDWARGSDTVCQSGTTSGAVCDLKNTGNFVEVVCGNDVYGNYECYDDLIEAQNVLDAPACRGGDSGGPVFTLATVERVIAKGTVTGCGGRFMYYQDFGTTWRDFGVVPVG